MKRQNARKAVLTTPQKRAAIYARVSTEEQADSGYGMAVQLERCRAMTIVKGWAIDAAHIFTDEGISGTKSPVERPGLTALLRAVEDGVVDTVIVLAPDRVGRRTQLVLDVVERISAAKVEFVSCKEALDTSTPAGRFVLTMFAALAQLERDNIVERTTAGRNHRGRIDGDKGGRVPFGYTRVPVVQGGDVQHVAEVDPVAAEVVRRIYCERRSKLSLRDIADGLNRDDIPTPQRGRAWHPSSITTILENRPIYRGALRGESSEHWPPIL